MKRGRTFTPNRRDIEVVQTVYEYRYLSVELLAALLCEPPAAGRQYGFTLSALRARCQMLREHGYLVWQHLRDEPVGRGHHGERPMVYSIGSAAVDMVAERTELSPRQLKAIIAKNIVSSFFLRHELGISKFRTCLDLACRASGGTVRVGTWLQGSLTDRVRIEGEGPEQVLPVVPDAAFSLVARGNDGRDSLSHYFLEYDTGTMSLPRIGMKALAFAEYLRQGLHQRRYTYVGKSADTLELRFITASWDEVTPVHQSEITGHSPKTFQVLFVTRAVAKDVEKLSSGKQPDRKRQRSMIETVCRATEIAKISSRFLFCTENLDYDLTRTGALFDVIWETINPKREKRAILFPMSRNHGAEES